MKKYYVYELYNQMGTIEYVGESTNTKRRWYEHSCKNGKFYKRLDIKMHIVKEFDIRRDAWDYQCQLQAEYGSETDSEKVTNIPNEETKQKMREAHKLRKPISNETKEKKRCIMIGNNYGKNQTKETREMRRNNWLNNNPGKNPSEETKQKMKDAWVIRKQNSAFFKK